MQYIICKKLLTHPLIERLEVIVCTSDQPVGHVLPWKINTLSGKLFLLTVKRHTVDILCVDDSGDKGGRCNASLYESGRSRRFYDGCCNRLFLTVPAGIDQALVLDFLELGRNKNKFRTDLFAHLVQRLSALRAGAFGCRPVSYTHLQRKRRQVFFALSLMLLSYAGDFFDLRFRKLRIR